MIKIFRSNRITKVRKLIKDRKWLLNRLRYLIEHSESLNSFKRWQCDSFFVGDTAASYNYKQFLKKNKQNDRRIAFIEKCFEKLNSFQ